ncbi:MAG: TetR/AcrR family transcriptional regulator [Phototrophicaceae bacterium]
MTLPPINDHSLLMPDADMPTRADAVRNRDRLLRTAATLFAQQGVAVVSMNAIAEAAGVGKGTLYRHFTNKSDLCHALLEEDMSALQAQVLTLLREQPDARLALLAFVELVLAFVWRNEALLAIEDSTQAPMLNHPAHIWWRQTLFGLLGRLGVDTARQYLADSLYVMLDVRVLRFQHHVLGYSTETIQAGMQRLIEHLLTPPTGAAS